MGELSVAIRLVLLVVLLLVLVILVRAVGL